MLHLVNGDATAARLAPATLPGDVLVWRDILVEGPAEADLDIARLAERRAPWLARRFGIDAAEYVANGRTQETGLARVRGEDEIVLWFEQDLFCVANLAYVAAWLEQSGAGARVSLIFPARPLGTAEPVDLGALFDARQPFSQGDVARAGAWWRAFSAPEPRDNPDVQGHGVLAFLERAWRLHLARFPSVATGLGVVETAALTALGDAPRPFPDLFRDVSADARIREHGMSDLQLAACLRALADGPSPLVRIDSPGLTDPDQRAIGSWNVTITDGGRDVLGGRRDRLQAQPLDWWLGGVHLAGRRTRWRWDVATERLMEGSDRT